MSSVKRLTKLGRRLVDSTFLSAQSNKVTAGEGDIEELQRVVALERFHKAVDVAISDYEKCDTTMDQELAPLIHEALPLTRREAGDTGVWHYLAVVERPDLVRHRWAPDSKTGLRARERFLGDLVRNSFARLWWGAELTFEPPADYSMTRDLFQKSTDLYEAIFGRAFPRHPAAMRAFLKEVGSAPEPVFRGVAKDLTHALTTFVLEDMKEVELASLIRDLKEAGSYK